MTPRRNNNRKKGKNTSKKSPAKDSVEVSVPVPRQPNTSNFPLLTVEDFNKLKSEHGPEMGSMIFQEKCLSAALQYARQVETKAHSEIIAAKNETIEVLKSAIPIKSDYKINQITGLGLAIVFMALIMFLPKCFPEFTPERSSLLVLQMGLAGFIGRVLPGHVEFEGKLEKLNDATVKAGGPLLFAGIPFAVFLIEKFSN